MNYIEIGLTIFIITTALIIGASILKIQNNAMVKLCGWEYMNCMSEGFTFNESCNKFKLDTCPNLSTSAII